MGYRIVGTYAASCHCRLVCPCPVDEKPNGPGDRCLGAGLFHIAEGQLDDVDLSGLDMALVNEFPSNISAGNLKVGIVVDQGASEEQAAALERIVKGEEGGPFGELSGLYGEWLGAERGELSFTSGDRPTFTIGGASSTFEPLIGPDGSHTTVKGAAFGFAPEFRIGHSSGHISALGVEFDADYGETADFEFASDMPEGASIGR